MFNFNFWRKEETARAASVSSKRDDDRETTLLEGRNGFLFRR